MRARVAALILAALIIPACHDDDDDDDDAPVAPILPGEPIPLAAVLGGTQEVPANPSSAGGTATFTVSGDRLSIAFTVTTTAGGITGVHIHPGTPGENGGILFDLGQVGGLTSPISGTLTANHFTPASGVGSYMDAVAALAAGTTYVDVHTGSFVDGEIRGQIGPSALASVRLSPAQEAPPPAAASTGTGSFNLTFSNDQTSMNYSLSASGLTSAATLAHIHVGEEGVAGPPIFTLTTAGFSGTLTGTLTAAQFTAGGGVDSYAEGVNAILSGRTYVNVHTANNPDGEVRGQIGAARLAAILENEQEVQTPPVASPGSGQGTVVLNGLQTAAIFSLTFTNLTSPATGAHVHEAPAGTNGPIIIDLGGLAGNLNSPMNVGSGVDPGQVDAMLSGRTYFNVHTTTYPDGEVRGQIGAGGTGSTKP